MVQRTARASVRVDGLTIAEIGAGLLVLLAVGPGDDGARAERLAARVAALRIFADSSGRMNVDVAAVAGAVLVVSQFTLYADTSRGHRPSFAGAADREHALALCDAFVEALRAAGLTVASGRFGARMEVELVNDGPVTLVLSSGEEPWNADAG